MIKTKILCSLSALVLVLSLGACTETLDDTKDTSEGETTYEEISEYTLNFIFLDNEGNQTTIPEYATAYIIGSWDSWTEFLELTESSGTYSYTFSSIVEGTYTYKGVMYYTDKTVSWENCVEIITDNGKDAPLTISKEDEGGQTIEIELTETLAAPITDEDICNDIFDSINSIEDLSTYWSAIHLTTSGDGQEELLYLTTKSGYPYGYSYLEDTTSKETVESYILDGYQYTYKANLTSNEEEYDTQTYSKKYEDIVKKDEYLEIFDLISNILDEENETYTLETTDFVLTKSGSSYTLVITESKTVDDNQHEATYTYTYVTNSSYELTAFGYKNDDSEEGVKEYYLEKTSASTVESHVKNFNINLWTPVDDVEDLLTRVSQDYNYTIEITYTETVSDEYDSEEELLESDYESTLTTDSYKVYIYYTEDAMLLQYYMDFYGQQWLIFNAELFVNDYENDRALYYIDLWDVYNLTYYGYAYGIWQKAFASFNLSTLAQYSSNFVKGEPTTGEYGLEYPYTLAESDELDLEFISLLITCMFTGYNDLYLNSRVSSPDNIFNLASDEDKVNFTSTYYADIETWEASMTTGLIEQTGQIGFTSSGTIYWYEEDAMSARVYNVDHTKIPSEYQSLL